MKKKLWIIICCALAAVLLIAGITCAVLYSKGLLGFYHPQQKAKQGQIKIACVGDSITYGFGVAHWGKSNYPAQLQQMLGDGFCVNNYGYSGRTVQTAGDRPYTAEKLYAQSKAFQPDIVLLMLGSNDSKPYNWNKDRFAEDYRALLESYVNLPNHPKVYVMAPPPVFEVGGKVNYDINQEIIADKIVPVSIAIAKSMHIPVIDMYKVFENKPTLFSDGCHPTAAGAKIIAGTVRSRLSRDLTAQ